jgi:hypothetical protein
MIFAHLLIGIILGQLFGSTPWFVLGSLMPDIDHIYVMLRNRFWSVRKIRDSLAFEDRHGVKYKTPLLHSVFGAALLTAAVFLLHHAAAVPFSIGYLFHLFVDWPDIDEKRFLFPFGVKFRGFLPIWSKAEQVLTVLLLILLTAIYLFRANHLS